MSEKQSLQKKNDIILRSEQNGGKVELNASELQSTNTNPIRVKLKERHGKKGITQVMEFKLDKERIRKSLETSCPKEAIEKVQPALLEIINQRIEKQTPLISVSTPLRTMYATLPRR
mgnify:CR=1 FL=1